MRALRTAFVALVVVVSLQASAAAQQNLTINLFERALEQLRHESGIPGLSAVIVHDRRIVWERGLGLADVERAIPAGPDTPYLVGDLTQTLGATLVLQCIDRGHFVLGDRMLRWTTMIPEPNASIGQVLRHTSTGIFSYDPARFAAVTPVVEYYMRLPFRKALAVEILERLAMRNSVPGRDLEEPSPLDLPFFDADDLGRYREVLRNLAVPYQVDIRRRPTRGDYPPRTITAGSGLVSTAHDLALFDIALDDGVLLSEPARAAMRQRGGAAVPTGLGWFVQRYNNVDVVWHFGNLSGGYSGLILKVPSRELTLILLANSDGLSAPFALDQGDVTTSLFARTFLRTFVP